MIKFTCTQEDLGNLGYPMDMKKEIYRNYYNWIKEDKPVLEFTCTVERSLEYCEDFLKETDWIK